MLPDFAVHDIEFIGDWLYGITPGDDLLAFRVGEDGDGKPTVTKFKRVIKHPLADGTFDFLSWMDDDGEEEEEEEVADEAPNQDDDDDDDDKGRRWKRK